MISTFFFPWESQLLPCYDPSPSCPHLRFTHWYGTSTSYTTDLTDNCEPWYVVGRRYGTQYDVRFRGYGWNKVQQVVWNNA